MQIPLTGIHTLVKLVISVLLLMVLTIAPLLAARPQDPVGPPHTPTPSPDQSNRPAIIGGEAAEEGEFPWVVAVGSTPITMPDSQQLVSQFCGGSLITEEWVLTAAHCFFNPSTGQQDFFASDIQLFLGGLNWTQNTAGSQRINVKTIIIHESYDPILFLNDIAVLQLEEPVDIPTASISLIPIITREEEETLAAPDMISTVAGWGKTSSPTGEGSTDLLKVDLPIVANDDCKPFGNDVAGVPDTQICAGGDGGRDSCQGDSGSPLIVPKGDSFVQVGIVSYGPAICAQEGKHGAYTRVSRYRDWISEQIGETLPSEQPTSTDTPTSATSTPTATPTTEPTATVTDEPTTTVSTEPTTTATVSTEPTTTPTETVTTEPTATVTDEPAATVTARPTQSPGNGSITITIMPSDPGIGQEVTISVQVAHSAEGDFLEVDAGDGSMSNPANTRLTESLVPVTREFSHTYMEVGAYTITAEFTSSVYDPDIASLSVTVDTSPGTIVETPTETPTQPVSTPGSENLVYLPLMSR